MDNATNQDSTYPNPEGPATTTFVDKDVILEFIRKIYGIWTIHYLAAALIASMFVVFEGLNHWTRESQFMQIAIFPLIVFIIVLVHLLKRAEFVGNLGCLIILTLALGLGGGIISARLSTAIVLYLWMGPVLFLLVILYTLQKKWDIIGITFICYLAGVEVAIWGLLMLSLPRKEFPTLDIFLVAVFHTLFLCALIVSNVRQIARDTDISRATSPLQYMMSRFGK